MGTELKLFPAQAVSWENFRVWKDPGGRTRKTSQECQIGVESLVRGLDRKKQTYLNYIHF